MQLTRLIYASVHGGISTEVVDEILRQSRKNNERDNITGALVVGGNHFMQLLEGGRTAVSDCFMRIMQDDRHRAIQVIYSGDAERRIFLEWRMHLIEESRINRDILSRYMIDGVFDPTRMSEFAIRDLCRALSAGDWDLQAA